MFVWNYVKDTKPNASAISQASRYVMSTASKSPEDTITVKCQGKAKTLHGQKYVDTGTKYSMLSSIALYQFVIAE